MECGYTLSHFLNELQPLSNPHRKVDKLSVIHNDLDNVKSSYYAGEKKNYLSIRSYENLGKSIVISILDLFELNPFSRLLNGPLKTLPELRHFIGESINKLNKEFKAYSYKNQQFPLQVKREQAPLILKKAEREKINQTCTVSRTLPKAIIGFFDKKIISSKIISVKNESTRRRTLPKMKTYK